MSKIIEPKTLTIDPRRRNASSSRRAVEEERQLAVRPDVSTARNLSSSYPPLLVSGREARRLLGVGTTKYFQLIRTGEIDTVLVGRRRQVSYASIERLAGGGTGS